MGNLVAHILAQTSAAPLSSAQLRNDLAAANKRADEAEKDAKRYRWLRLNPEAEDIYGRMTDELDKAIDEAMKNG